MKTLMKTVVGLLKTRDEAQFAIYDLVNCGFDRDRISLRTAMAAHHTWPGEEEAHIEQGETDAFAREGVGSRGIAYEVKVPVGPADIAALTELGVPDADAQYYVEGVRNGGFLVTVVTDNERAEEAAEVIRRHGSVDIDEGAPSWRSQEVWTGVEEREFRRHPTPSGERVFPGSEHLAAERSEFGAAREAEQTAAQGGRREFREQTEPLSHATLDEQMQRKDLFEEKEELPRELAEQHRREHLFNEKETLPHPAAAGEDFRQQDTRLQDMPQTDDPRNRVPQQHIFKSDDQKTQQPVQQHDAQMRDVQQREWHEGMVQQGIGSEVQQSESIPSDLKQREFEPGEIRQPDLQQVTGAERGDAEAVSLSEQQVQPEVRQVDVSAMDDEEFERHFRATYAARGERFDEPYRSAYHFAEAESSSHPQFLNKEWGEVEEEIHRDWEQSHPGTWNKVEDAIHFGWNRRRHH